MNAEIVEIAAYLRQRSGTVNMTTEQMLDEYFDQRVIWSKEKSEWQIMNSRARHRFCTAIMAEVNNG